MCVPIYFSSYSFTLPVLNSLFAKHNCKLHNPFRLALLYAGCAILQIVKFKNKEIKIEFEHT